MVLKSVFDRVLISKIFSILKNGIWRNTFRFSFNTKYLVIIIKWGVYQAHFRQNLFSNNKPTNSNSIEK